jgi:hypothetical protein
MATDEYGVASPHHACDIVLVQGTHDADGFPCGRPASETCCDCGSELCDLHTEACDLCGQVFCSMCFWLHMKQSAAKPAQPAPHPERIKRRA